MCGIVGCLALALEADPDQNWVQTATERITHRGPDDEGFYTDPDVALGFRRLAIIDLSPGGHQPMRSADGRYWMVYNGEIYNYVELGQELRQQGVTLRTTSDSEVLLEMYALLGKDVVHRLRGMFAFAIWDTWTRELFCARDQFGIKPFYYTVDPVPAQNGYGGAADQRGRPGAAAEQAGRPRAAPRGAGGLAWWAGGAGGLARWAGGAAGLARWAGGAAGPARRRAGPAVGVGRAAFGRSARGRPSGAACGGQRAAEPRRAACRRAGPSGWRRSGRRPGGWRAWCGRPWSGRARGGWVRRGRPGCGRLHRDRPAAAVRLRTQVPGQPG